LNQLQTKQPTITAAAGMVLIWSRCDDYCYQYDFDFDSESANNKDITRITIEPDTIVGKPFFSGRNLENIITNLQYDELALSCWVSRDLDKIIISKKIKKKNKEI
jgi:hypothetical protein